MLLVFSVNTYQTKHNVTRSQRKAAHNQCIVLMAAEGHNARRVHSRLPVGSKQRMHIVWSAWSFNKSWHLSIEGGPRSSRFVSLSTCMRHESYLPPTPSQNIGIFLHVSELGYFVQRNIMLGKMDRFILFV